MPDKLHIVEATPSLAWRVFSDLSKFGAEDLTISGARAEDFEREIEVSTICHVAFWNERPAAMWGIRPNSMFMGNGYVWLVTTSVVESYPFQFVRYSRLILKDLLRLFPVLHGIVMPKQERNIRWLRLLGFEVGPPEWVHGERYRRFVMRRA